jgi:hypothetical protein
MTDETDYFRFADNTLIILKHPLNRLTNSNPVGQRL